MLVNLTRSFERDLRRVSDQEQDAVIAAVRTFVESPHTKGLNFHPVRSREGYFTIRANRAVRVLLRQVGKQEYDVVAVGNHDYVYQSFFR